MTAYRIVLATGQMMLRQALKTMLEKKDLEVVGNVVDDISLIELLDTRNIAPHMIILAHPIPNLDLSDTLRKIKTTCPDVKVLIVSMHRDKWVADHFFSLGAEGYVVKANLYEELFPAIDIVRKGGVYIPPFLSNSTNGPY